MWNCHRADGSPVRSGDRRVDVERLDVLAELDAEDSFRLAPRASPQKLRRSCNAAHMSFLPSTSAEDVIGQPDRTRPVPGVPRRAPQRSQPLPGRADRGASTPIACAVPDHAPRPGKTRDLRREGLVRRSHHPMARAEIGIPATPDESFILDDTDTIASISQAHRQGLRDPRRRATASRALDDMGHRQPAWPVPPCGSGSPPLLRELAQHCGHADILREQIVNHKPCP